MREVVPPGQEWGELEGFELSEPGREQDLVDRRTSDRMIYAT